MKRIVVAMVLLMTASLGIAQTDIPNLNATDTNGETLNLNDREGRYLLLVASEAGCSFTYTALERIQPLGQCGQLDVVVLDYESEDRVVDIYHDFKVYYTFVAQQDAAKEAFKKQFSPQYQLFSPEGKRLWKGKGLKKLDLDQLREFIDCEE